MVHITFDDITDYKASRRQNIKTTDTPPLNAHGTQKTTVWNWSCNDWPISQDLSVARLDRSPIFRLWRPILYLRRGLGDDRTNWDEPFLLAAVGLEEARANKSSSSSSNSPLCDDAASAGLLLRTLSGFVVSLFTSAAAAASQQKNINWYSASTTSCK